ncbi:MAG: WG repeat-containing protein [Rikenellaceae bacterium]|nr:WG repeat-containing protein [Rikenellaceae bacterium]
MQYPTTVRYAETILNPDGLLRSLPGLSSSVPPDFSSGAYGVVFRVEVAGKPCALKCFTRHQPGRAEAYRRIVRILDGVRESEEGSRYLVPLQWLEDEITVFGEDDTASVYPAVLMDWVEGRSLTREIAAAVSSSDKEALGRLSEAFDRMALWLLAQPFAHGDLKPDNIMVRPDGGLALIDYDGLYLPEMAGERAREIGTEGFRHPERSETVFGKHIDDFPVALISLGLRALALWPELYGRFGGTSLLLFDPQLLAGGDCPAYNHLKNTELAADPLFAMLGSGAERMDGLPEALAAHLPAGAAVGISEYDYMGEAGREGIRLVRRGGKYGFVGAGGRVVAECAYDRAREFSEGAAAVCRKGLWGFIGTEGEWLREPEYEDCGDFSEGLAPVCIGGKWGFADGEFRLLSRPRFDDAWPFAEGRALVRKGFLYGYAGPDGKMAIPARYDFAQGFREGAACVMVKGLYGYIDRRGRYLVEPEFDYARSKRDGRAYVEREGKGSEIGL